MKFKILILIFSHILFACKEHKNPYIGIDTFDIEYSKNYFVIMPYKEAYHIKVQGNTAILRYKRSLDICMNNGSRLNFTNNDDSSNVVFSTKIEYSDIQIIKNNILPQFDTLFNITPKRLPDSIMVLDGGVSTIFYRDRYKIKEFNYSSSDGKIPYFILVSNKLNDLIIKYLPDSLKKEYYYES